MPVRAAGDYVEPAVSGPSLQVSLDPKRAIAEIDLGAGRFRVPMDRQTYVVSPADTQCRYAIPEPVDLLVIEFPTLTFSEGSLGVGRALERMQCVAFDDPLVVALAQRMWSLSGRQVTSMEAEGLTLALGCLVANAQVCDRPPPPARGGLAPWQVKLVSDHLQADLAADTGLAELAVLVDLSTEHFARAFKASTGLPPHTWLIARRVERASVLLTGTNLTVEKIAAQVGYAEPSHFARTFRRSQGVSPTQYRREQRI